MHILTMKEHYSDLRTCAVSILFSAYVNRFLEIIISLISISEMILLLVEEEWAERLKSYRFSSPEPGSPGELIVHLYPCSGVRRDRDRRQQFQTSSTPKALGQS